jgi:hypothetical protein
MKKLITLFTFVLSLSSLFSQTATVDTIKGDISFSFEAKDASGNVIKDAGGNNIVNTASAFTKNVTLTNDKIWILRGFTYVRAGATITIQPGTIIRGDKGTKATLIVTRGGKINAEGTATRPIVFTSNQAAGSRKAGDWGGIIILGKARNNGNYNNIAGELQIEGGVDTPDKDGLHGGTDDNDNSGVLKYVRIEYSGIPFVPNSEINGLTMGSVGKGTKIDYVQVSYNGDDSFEWFGGAVDSKYLISLGTTDDDFDTDFGFRGNVQFGLAVRDANNSDIPGDSNGFESDNNATGTYATPLTAPVFSNMTILGLSNGVQPAGQKFNTAARLRRNSRISIFNSIFAGFPNAGVFVEGVTTAIAAVGDTLRFKNNIISGNGIDASSFSSIRPFTSGTGSPTIKSQAWLMTAAYKNDTTAVLSSLLSDPFSTTPTPAKFAAKAGSAAASGAEFTDSYIDNAFFTKVAFKGALDETSTWMNGWTNFNPQNTDYTKLTSAVGELSADIFTATIYPNPTKDNAILSFAVEKDMNLAITVYDLMGRQISAQNNRRYAKGSYSIDINSSTLSSGMYFVNFSSEEGQKTMRFSVSK